MAFSEAQAAEIAQAERQGPIRFSRLKLLRQGPFAYRHERRDRFAGPALRIGSAVDARIFDADQGAARIKIWDGVRRGKAWEEFKAPLTDRDVVLSDTEAETVARCVDSLARHRQATDLLSNGSKQQRLEWLFDGRHCQGTPDIFTADTIVDLKTTQSADPDFWWRCAQCKRNACTCEHRDVDCSCHPKRREGELEDRGYHAQLSWYRHALGTTGPPTPSKAKIVAVETSWPYPVVVFDVTGTLARGEQLWREWWDKLKYWEARGWPESYADEEVVLK